MAACSAVAPRPSARVFVVTTRRGRHLFGVHRADSSDMYTSYVLGFDRNEHAMALAKGLEAYRRANGQFPPRDLTEGGMDLPGCDLRGAETMTHVAVDELPLPDLIWRLRGTGIVLSLLTAVDDDPEDITFRWQDVRPDCEDSVQRLNAVLLESEALWGPPERLAAGLPGLLPKPRRPVVVERVLEALCKLAKRASGL